MNDDLISRASLLKGIEELKESLWYTNGKGKNNSVNPIEAIAYTERMEAVEIIEDMCIKQEPAVTIGVDLANDSGWISVKDRLPEEYEQVLLVAEVQNSFIFSKTERVITIGRLKPSCKWQAIGMEYLDMEVTHWQTLPALPKGE